MRKKLTALFVDDQARYRTALISEMTEFNIECVGEAANGIECLELLIKLKPDVVLLDLEMPIMNGRETFDSIKLMYPKQPVIILSQHDDTGLIENYMHRGVKGFIPKGIIDKDAEVLAKGIKTVTDGKPFFPTYDKSSAIKYTKKETIVAPRIIDGKTSKEIANELGIEEKKVSKIRTTLHKKTNTRNATEFVAYGVIKGLKYLGER